MGDNDADTNKEMVQLSVVEAAVRFRDGTLTPSELTEAYLSAIKGRNPRLNAYLEVFSERARAEAAEADKRFEEDEPRGLLDGMPVAVKDNILIAGTRTTAGSKILEPYIASYDATVIARLKKEGVVFLGKTNLDEFAMGSSTEHSAFGATRNPHDENRVPGGSSGGSAAAAGAHLCAAALGSDTGGSIRQPAAFCGVVGLKPTYGTVSRSGLIAMASSLDQIGPMTKTVEDAEVLFAAIAGRDNLDATAHASQGQFQIPDSESEIPKLRIGLPKEYFGEGLDDRIRKRVTEAVEALQEQGATVKEVSLPHAPYALAVYYLIMPSEASSNLARFDGIRYGSSTLRVERGNTRKRDAETREKKFQDFWDVYFETRRQYFGDEPKRRIMLGTFALSSGYYEAYYARAQKVRALIKKDFDTVFDEVDVLVAPTSPVLPFRFGERSDDPLAMYLADIYTVSANLAGIPAMSVPFGRVKEDGKELPVGVQLMAKPFAEPTLFAAGKALETAQA